MAWSSADIPDQQGRVCIVTGSNTGLGLSNARMLAEKGATVIMACRNLDKANAAAAGIRAKVPAADVRISALDLSSLASVRDFAARFLAEHDRLAAHHRCPLALVLAHHRPEASVDDVV